MSLPQLAFPCSFPVRVIRQVLGFLNGIDVLKNLLYGVPDILHDQRHPVPAKDHARLPCLVKPDALLAAEGLDHGVHEEQDRTDGKEDPNEDPEGQFGEDPDALARMFEN